MPGLAGRWPGTLEDCPLALMDRAFAGIVLTFSGFLPVSAVSCSIGDSFTCKNRSLVAIFIAGGLIFQKRLHVMNIL